MVLQRRRLRVTLLIDLYPLQPWNQTQIRAEPHRHDGITRTRSLEFRFTCPRWPNMAACTLSSTRFLTMCFYAKEEASRSSIIRRFFSVPPQSTISLASKPTRSRQQSLDRVKDSRPKREKEKGGTEERKRDSLGRNIHHHPSVFKAWLAALRVKYVDGGAQGIRKEGVISGMKRGSGEGQWKKERE